MTPELRKQIDEHNADAKSDIIGKPQTGTPTENLRARLRSTPAGKRQVANVAESMNDAKRPPMQVKPSTPAYKQKYGKMTDSELSQAKLAARKRAETDISASQDIKDIMKEQADRELKSRDVAKAPKVPDATPRAQTQSLTKQANKGNKADAKSAASSGGSPELKRIEAKLAKYDGNQKYLTSKERQMLSVLRRRETGPKA